MTTTELAGVLTSHGAYCIGCADCWLAPAHCQECGGKATKNYASLGRLHKPCGLAGRIVGWDDNHERVIGIEVGRGELCVLCEEALPGEQERIAI